MQSVKSDLHKYFKTQKNSQQFGKAKHIVTSIIDDGNSLSENKIVKNISQSLSKSRALSSKAVADASQRILDFSLASSLQKCESSNVITKKRKQQQVEDLDDNIAPIFKETKLKCENKKKSSIKRLRLDLKTNNTEQGLDNGKTSITANLKSEDIRKRISKCSHASELQTRVQRCLSWVNKSKGEDDAVPVVAKPSLKSPYKAIVVKGNTVLCSPHKISLDRPKLEIFKSINLEVPVSPSKSPFKLASPLKKLSSPVKTSQRARFGLLAEYSSSAEADQLVFPKNYQIIQEEFRATDTVVSLRHNRQEMTIFSKLKRDVCEMIRRTFSEVHLGRLKTVFPLAYIFKQEKIISKESDSYNVASYQLTIQPNFNYKQAFSANLMQKFVSDPASGVANKFCKMDWNILLERKNKFHESLLAMLRKCHEEFLKRLDPPISLTGPVSRWHEDFLSSEINLPEPSPLPQSPEENEPKTAQQVMEQGRNLFSVNNRMKAALEAVAASKTMVSTNKIASAAIKESAAASHLKGLPSSLLEKIRAREREKAVRDMCRSSKESKELEMLSRLPQLASNIWSIFVSVKKATILWEEMVSYVGSCDKNDIPQHEIPEHLKNLLNILGKEIPGWCVLINIRGEQRLKLIEKERKVSDITEILNKVIKQKS